VAAHQACLQAAFLRSEQASSSPRLAAGAAATRPAAAAGAARPRSRSTSH